MCKNYSQKGFLLFVSQEDSSTMEIWKVLLRKKSIWKNVDCQKDVHPTYDQQQETESIVCNQSITQGQVVRENSENDQMKLEDLKTGILTVAVHDT